MVVSSHLNFLYIPDSCLNHIAAWILRAFCRLSILHILHRLRDSPNMRCSCVMAGTPCLFEATKLDLWGIPARCDKLKQLTTSAFKAPRL